MIHFFNEYGPVLVTEKIREKVQKFKNKRNSPNVQVKKNNEEICLLLSFYSIQRIDNICAYSSGCQLLSGNVGSRQSVALRDAIGSGSLCLFLRFDAKSPKKFRFRRSCDDQKISSFGRTAAILRSGVR